MTRAPATEPDRLEAPISRREFRLSDAMILLAGAALSLSAGAHLFAFAGEQAGRLATTAWAHRDEVLEHWPLFRDAIRFPLVNLLWYGFQVCEMVLVGMTPAFWVVRLRRRRPPWSVLVRTPGTLAGLAIVFGLFWIAGLVHWLVPERADAATTAGIAVGGTVAVAWGLLALGRGWRAEPGWVDRVGIALGGVAIATAALGLTFPRL